MAGTDLQTGPNRAGGQPPVDNAAQTGGQTPVEKTKQVSSGQLGGGNSVDRDSGNSAGALYSGLFHDLDAAGTQTLSAMILNITALSAKLQDSRAESTKNRVGKLKEQLKKNDTARVKLEQKQGGKQDKVAKHQKVGKILSWLGLGLSGLMTVVSLGTATPAAAFLMTASLVVGAVQQGLTASGTMAKLADKDPTAAKALQGSLMAVQILLSIATLKVGSASSTVAKAADESGGLIAAADDTANLANMATGEGEVLDQLTDIAMQGGNRMATASTGEEQAEILFDTLDDMLEVANKAAGEADEGVTSLSSASDEIVSAQKNQARIVDSEGVIDPEGQDIAMKIDDPDAPRIKDLANKTNRGLSAAKVSTDGVGAVNDVDIAKLNRDLTQLQGDLKKVSANQTTSKVVLDELEDALKQILEAYNDVMNSAVEIVEKTHQTNSKVANNIGANPAQAV